MTTTTSSMPAEVDPHLFPIDIPPVGPLFLPLSSLPVSIDSAQITPTDYGAFVTKTLARGKRDTDSNTIDQKILRNCLSLASSFLMTDTTIDPQFGVITWSTGLVRLVDLVIVLHKRDELELETLSCASKACSECWTATGNWRGLAECRQCVREVGEKLKKILDNDKTYKGIEILVYFFLLTSLITGQRIYSSDAR
ncbi:hypothetical protein CVT25_011189 [Psilocybe cyanescens]|uniref:Uncharacterized protein n=1 Tax=Psilocybe cyanescens TaxID=93625 RepID=A0A409WGX1_PSICY|nr:hypothetical protein CVT25_011189 [Psilocybe cyanescens]